MVGVSEVHISDSHPVRFVAMATLRRYKWDTAIAIRDKIRYSKKKNLVRRQRIQVYHEKVKQNIEIRHVAFGLITVSEPSFFCS